jgi:hypothetical protein
VPKLENSVVTELVVTPGHLSIWLKSQLSAFLRCLLGPVHWATRMFSSNLPHL